ncbi:hypothetical protein [Kitasatospora albolonga]|uniref:hypothetical protein n=1 Tax=Kitasatospora albolonga TaxID=68173 RepID=UPI0035F0914A
MLRVCLAGVLVAAVLAAVPRAGTGRGLPVQLLAAEPAPGRIVYAADQSHRALVLAAGSEAPTTALLPPGSAGEDCQPSVRGDALVWVSDRSGQGERLMWRQGEAPAKVLLERPGWRLKHPALSPDGQWLAFTSWQSEDRFEGLCRQDEYQDSYPVPEADDTRDEDHRPGLWVVRTDGSGLRRLAVDAGWGSWSPDGRQLAYEHADAVYRVPFAPGGPAVRVATGTDKARRPAWEPVDGEGHGRIAFLAGAPDGVPSIGTVPPGGGTPTWVVKYAGRDLAWSPDGRRIAFLWGGYASEVEVDDECGGCTARQVAYSTHPFESAAWYTRAGGRQPIVLLTEVNGSYRHLESAFPSVPLERLDLVPQDLRRRIEYRDPAWSPDGRRLAFVQVLTRSEAPDDYRLMVGDPADLAHAAEVAGDGVGGVLIGKRRPAWSPDGTRLAYAEGGGGECGDGGDCPEDEMYQGGEVKVVDLSAGADRARVLFTVPERAAPRSRCHSQDLDPSWSADGTRIALSRASQCFPEVGVAGRSAGPGSAALGSGGAGVGGQGPNGARPSGASASGTEASGMGASGAVDRGLAARRSAAPGPAAAEWSRERLASEERGGARHIWTVSAVDGSDQRDLTARQCGIEDCPVRDERPAYAPEGDRLAFSRVTLERPPTPTPAPPSPSSPSAPPTPGPLRALDSYDTENRTLLTMAGSAADCRQVVPRSDACPTYVRPAPPGDGPFREPAAPAWSPDGRQLVFETEQVEPDGDGEYRVTTLGLADAVSGEGRLLPGPVYGEQTTPTWQPTADLEVTLAADRPQVAEGDSAELTLTVSNLGPAPARPTTADLALPAGLVPTGVPTPSQGTCTGSPPAPPPGCTLGTLRAGERATVRVTVTARALGPQTGTGSAGTGTGTGSGTTAGAGTVDPRPENNRAEVTVAVTARRPSARPDPAVTVALDPATAHVGGTVTARVTVRNLGGTPATGVTLATQLPPGAKVVSGCTEACPVALPTAGAEEVVTVVFRPAAAASTVSYGATVTAALTVAGDDEQPGNDTASATLTVLRPAVLLSPPIGPPGTVTLAYGSQFPPGAELRLSWSAGVTAAAAPVRVGADGAFAAPVLVMRQDVLGARELVVRQAAPGDPVFGEVRTGFRVVPGVLQPRDFQWRR